MAGGARGRPTAGRLLPRRLHAAVRDRRHRLPQQGRGLRSAVPDGIGDHADDRRRPASPRRPHRHHRRAPHLGLGADPPPAHPHDRAGRRDLARRHALGLVAAGLPSSGPRARQAVPPALRLGAARASCRGAAPLLRRQDRAERPAGVRTLPGAHQDDEMGRLQQAALRRPSACHSFPASLGGASGRLRPRPCWPTCHATRTASPSRTGA